MNQKDSEIKYFILKMDFLKIKKILGKIQEHICINYKMLLYSLSENLLILNNMLEKLLITYNEKLGELQLQTLNMENNNTIDLLYKNVIHYNNLNYNLAFRM